MERSSHIAALDGVRGIAVLWVVLHNAMDMLAAPDHGVYHLIAMLAHPGWIGVQLFFVLSGFLITGNLLDTRGCGNYYGSFFWRRVLRILPLYYGALLALLMLLRFGWGPPELAATQHNQIWLWSFLSNWTQPFDSGVYGYGHFWSLAVEEQFYLLWPFIIIRLSTRQVVRFCTALIGIALLARTAMAFAHVSWEAIYSFTFCRMDALASGSAAAALLRLPDGPEMWRERVRMAGPAAVILFMLGIAITRGYDANTLACETIGYTILSLCCAVLIIAAAIAPAGPRWPIRIFRSMPLRSLGKYSYAMYVFHVPIHKLIGISLLAAIWPTSIPADAAVAYAFLILFCSWLLAVASYHLFEKHFLRLKSRYMPQPHRAAREPAPQ